MLGQTIQIYRILVLATILKPGNMEKLQLCLSDPKAYYKKYGIIVDRESKQVTRWRRMVFNRDKHICQDCGSTKDLHVHHMKRWSDFPQDRIDIDNGKTLCVFCHAKEHPEQESLILSHVR